MVDISACRPKSSTVNFVLNFFTSKTCQIILRHVQGDCLDRLLVLSRDCDFLSRKCLSNDTEAESRVKYADLIRRRRTFRIFDNACLTFLTHFKTTPNFCWKIYNKAFTVVIPLFWGPNSREHYFFFIVLPFPSAN